MWGRLRVVVSSSRGGNGLHGAPPHRSIHKEAAENHIGEVGLSACLCTVHGRRDNVGDKLDDDLVGSRHGK